MDIADSPPAKPTSGRIIPHNLHLLNDSYDDQETGSFPSKQQVLNNNNPPFSRNGDPSDRRSAMEISGNMGGESPGVPQPNGDTKYPDQFRDSLDDQERPASNSSAVSRGLDDSPVDDNPEDTKSTLSAEKQYQDDLKERVRQSFKDLGMEPEGVLKDQEGRSAKRKKKKRQAAPKSNAAGGPQDSSEDGYEDESPNHANEPAEYADEQANYADEQQANYADEPANYADEAANYAGEPSNYADDPHNYADDPRNYADDPSNYADDPSNYADEPAAHADEPANYGDEQDAYANEPAGNAYPDPGDTFQGNVTPKGYPDDRGAGINDPNEAYPDEGDPTDDQTPRGYPNEGIPHGYPNEGTQNDDPVGGYEGEQDDTALDDGGATPVRHPVDNEHLQNHREPQSFPETYPDPNQYGDNNYGSTPHEATNSDPYADEDQGNNPASVDQVGGNYPNQDTYLEGSSYPDNDGYAGDTGYPDEGGYPEDDAYGENPAPENAYPTDINGSNYPKEGTPDAHPTDSYPSRYDNHGYPGDDNQYDDRNHTNHTPPDNDPYDQTPRDSLDYDQPAAVSNNYPTNDSPHYDDQQNTAVTQNYPIHQEAPDDFPQDSLEFGNPEPVPEQTYPSHVGSAQDNPREESAPYDSLDEEEPYHGSNKTPPKDVSRVPDAPPKLEHKPKETWQGEQRPSVAAVTHIQKDVPSSNNSSANSSRELPNGSSAGSRKLSGSPKSPSIRGSAGVQGLPPQGRQKPPSRSGSRGLGSRGTNRAGYADLARRQGSANQKGSAGSDKSTDGRSRRQDSQRQVGSGQEQSRHSSQVSATQNRVRSLSNRIKTSPIPANELSAKELLKRSRTKSDVASGRPKVEQSNSQIIKKDGAEVRVSYISDDSGDEGEHFVDEKGSPVDQSGKPLFKDLHGRQKPPEEPKFEFRIKPTPPKQKSPLELQTVNARRTSAEDSSARKVPHSGKITLARPDLLDEPIIEKTTAVQTGTLEGALPPQKNALEEPIIRKTSAQKQGIDDATLPPQVIDRATQKEEIDSPASSASKSRTPFGEVRLRSVGTVMSGKSIGRGRTKPEAVISEDPYRDLRFEADAAEEHGRENKNAVEDAINRDLEAEGPKSAKTRTPPQRKPLSGTYNKKDFTKQAEDPRGSRGASRSSVQDRGIQYTPQEGQRRLPQASSTPQNRHDPAVPQPYNPQQQGYPSHQQDDYDNQQQQYHPNSSGPSSYYPQPGLHGGPPQPSQYHQDGHPVQQNWEQQHPGQPWNAAPPPQVPQQFYTGQPVPGQYDPQHGGHDPQEGYYIQPHQGYGPQMERPGLQQHNQEHYYDQQQPYDSGYQNYPAQQAVPPQGYINPSLQGPVQPQNRTHPGQGMHPNPGYHPNQDQPMQNEPPSQPRQRAPPKPKPNFIDINKVNLSRGPPRRKYGEMQKKAPTPTRINPKKPLPDISRESSQYDDPYADNPGSAQTWANEDWTRQLILNQQNLPLRRGHSDTNLYVQQPQPTHVQQGYYPPQGAPISSMPGYSDGPGAGYHSDAPDYQPGYNRTYPPQIPRNQSGQPYSYSADHATQYARNNGYTRPQLSGPPRARVAFADEYGNSFDSDMNPMTFANEGTGAGYQYAAKRTSPYQILPDIPGQHDKDGTSPLRKSDPDSYTARLLKQKQPPQYKEYTLRDYRNLKSDMRLGGLGPDQDLVAENQEKVIRQRDYAKQVMQQNKKQLQQTKRLWPNEAVLPKEEKASKRDIGIEYAKKVPKPRMPTPPEVLHDRLYGASSRQQAQEEAEHEERAASEMARLEELKARHEKEKEAVERLKTESAT